MNVLLDNVSFLILGIFLIAVLGYKARALTFSGSVGTVLVGVGISIGFGWKGLILIGIFFATSSILSKGKKEEITVIVDKGSQRDIYQVFANGAIPAIVSILYATFDSSFLLVAFITSIAVANSDTWASELGTKSKSKPVSIITLRRVEKGTSGAISLFGTGAALLGSGLISLSAYLLWDLEPSYILFFTILGFIGCFVDTLLGAIIQAKYNCFVCNAETEKLQHCEYPTSHTGGLVWVTNDVVNVSSIVIATIMSCVIYSFAYLY